MTGMIGKKAGMTQIFDDEGKLIPVTVIKMDDNIVLGSRTKDAHGYDALVVGAFPAKKKRVTKPVQGQFPKGVEPLKLIREFRNMTGEYKPGDAVSVESFQDVRFVDVIGVSKGKGYQGVIKRHNFGGGFKTHGSKFHREMGSTGQNTYPARTFKGKKMPGHMGNEKVTVQNLRVIRVDAEKKMLVVRGAVPGSVNNILVVTKAKRK